MVEVCTIFWVDWIPVLWGEIVEKVRWDFEACSVMYNIELNLIKLN